MANAIPMRLRGDLANAVTRGHVVKDSKAPSLAPRRAPPPSVPQIQTCIKERR